MNETIPKTSEELLAPLREFFAYRGNKAELTRRLKEALGSKTSRQQVERWLSTNPEARQEPRLSSGLALYRIGHEMMQAADQEDEEAEQEIAKRLAAEQETTTQREETK